ncbi:MAG TPA: zinc ribbon domain-containing protein [Ktedonobacterales bacterium]|nr:zinc ribbon domain-containing protein [Ktedonobacterales bacterium]
MQREIRLTPILLLVLGLTTVLVVGLILLLWTFLPPSLQSGLPFAISTVVIVNTALLRVIPGVGKRLIGGDSASAALANAQPQYAPQPQHIAYQKHHVVAAAPVATPACHRCGRVAQQGDAFCRQCGASLAALPTPPPAAMPQPIAQPAQPLARPPAYSAPRAVAPSIGAAAYAGPVTSVGGTVAVTPTVHRFMSKRVLRYLLFIGIACNIVAIVLYALVSIIVASCSPDADIYACSSTQTGVVTVLIILTLIIWVPGFVLVLLADVFALIRTVLVRRWGWFAAILVTYFFLWNVAMLFYVFIGPDEPPASQIPVVGKPPH